MPRKDDRVNSTPHVLVIDDASDTEIVLKAVLEPRGATVERSRGHFLDSYIERVASPDVLVIDLDAGANASDSREAWSQLPQVLIGTSPPVVSSQRATFIEKPFQYPELVRVIQQFLDEPAA